MARTKQYRGTLEKRGQSHRLIFYIDGERHTAKLETADRKEAEVMAAARYDEEVKRIERENAGVRVPRTFAELLDNFIANEMPKLSGGTQEAYNDTFKPVRQWFIDKQKAALRPDSIGPSHITRYLTWRQVNRQNGKDTLSNRTLAKDRAVLHRLFGYALRQQFITSNPVAAVDAPKSDEFEPVILTPDQFEALLAECVDRPMLRLYVLLLAETGARAYSEALRLRWEDVDLAEGFIWIRGRRQKDNDGRTKSGKGRWTPCTPRLLEALRAHFAAYRFATYNGNRAEYIFHHLTSGAHRVAGEQIKDMRGAFDKAAERAKLPEGFRRHDLRHLRVTTWLAEGRDVVLVKEAVGHSDLKTTMKYTHLVKANLKSLVGDTRPISQSARVSG